MQRTSTAHWRGGLKDGSGDISSGSGALKAVPYSFAKRFETEPGTNPEELIAAAHAACFSMAFSGNLGKSNIVPRSIETSSAITFEKKEAGWTLLESHLSTRVKAPGADKDAVRQAAEAAKAGCPVSRALNMKITLSLEVET